MENTKNNSKLKNPSYKAMYILKPQLIALTITSIVFIAVAILLTYTDFDESKISAISLICTAISCLVAGFDTAGYFGKKGLLWGATSGLVYSILMFLICILCGTNFKVNLGKLTTIIIAVAGGIIGGVLGVNTKSKSKHK